MDDGKLQFDRDQTMANFGELVEFDEVEGSDDDPVVAQLMARVQAARLAGVYMPA